MTAKRCFMAPSSHRERCLKMKKKKKRGQWITNEYLMTLCDSVYITCQKVFLSLRFVNSKGEITEDCITVIVSRRVDVSGSGKKKKKKREGWKDGALDETTATRCVYGCIVFSLVYEPRFTMGTWLRVVVSNWGSLRASFFLLRRLDWSWERRVT